MGRREPRLVALRRRIEEPPNAALQYLQANATANKCYRRFVGLDAITVAPSLRCHAAQISVCSACGSRSMLRPADAGGISPAGSATRSRPLHSRAGHAHGRDGQRTRAASSGVHILASRDGAIIQHTNHGSWNTTRNGPNIRPRVRAAHILLRRDGALQASARR